MEAHEKMDSLLLSTLIAQIESLKLPFDDEESPLYTLMSLLPGPSVPPHPPILTKSSLADERIQALYECFGNNNFSVHSHFNTYAHGIFPLASRLFNHSCVPNAAAKYTITPGSPVRMDIVALRSIADGEEICLPYIDPALLQTRRTVFQLTYGFTCQCPSCTLLDSIGNVPEPPESGSELEKLSKSLQTLVGSSTFRSPLVDGDTESFPDTLYSVLHESYLASLSERFSNAAHDGSYEVAMEAGATLTALYRLVYPPNYPQIGLHLLEFSKTAWNKLVSTNSHDMLIQQFSAALSEAEYILAEVLGDEGDNNDGPCKEIKVLKDVMSEEQKCESCDFSSPARRANNVPEGTNLVHFLNPIRQFYPKFSPVNGRQLKTFTSLRVFKVSIPGAIHCTDSRDREKEVLIRFTEHSESEIHTLKTLFPRPKSSKKSSCLRITTHSLTGE
ncbi:hypothetical protein PM082_017361 [Marasmius tenuissimus]|nr:hypothetical protein PM082_017361 [Marasmius tenuissimus]